MPLSTVIFLAAVVAMFAIFAAALAWAQIQTRHLVSAPATATARPQSRKRPL